MKRYLLLFFMLVFITVGVSMARAMSTPSDADNGFVWKSEVPDDCPFEPSQTLTGIFFTGRHSDYHCGDTFYPSWASDGYLYSPWTDGTTDGVSCKSGYDGNMAHTDHAVMIGNEWQWEIF